MKNEIKNIGKDAVERVKKEYRDSADFLHQERDELKLHMHLASAEVKDQWHELEKTWSQFQSRADVVGKVTGESAAEVGDATRQVAEELKTAYRRIRDSLKQTL